MADFLAFQPSDRREKAARTDYRGLRGIVGLTTNARPHADDPHQLRFRQCFQDFRQRRFARHGVSARRFGPEKTESETENRALDWWMDGRKFQ